jgi:hypothetical protein
MIQSEFRKGKDGGEGGLKMGVSDKCVGSPL